jgi:hypothetical protein
MKFKQYVRCNLTGKIFPVLAEVSVGGTYYMLGCDRAKPYRNGQREGMPFVFKLPCNYDVNLSRAGRIISQDPLFVLSDYERACKTNPGDDHNFLMPYIRFVSRSTIKSEFTFFNPPLSNEEGLKLMMEVQNEAP